MESFQISLRSMITSLWGNRHLIGTLTRREIVGRYRGSMIGIAWSFLNPIIMLMVYTFVFTVIFQARWNLEQADNKAAFALFVFVGLIVHGIFAECIDRSPGLILHNSNYVKKVVFPLEVLPWVSMGTALFHAGINFLVLLVAQLFIMGAVPWTVILLPIYILPLVFGIQGICWFLAALGVYLRDIAQITGMVSTVLLFVSAVFYPIHALPVEYRKLIQMNPLAAIIQQGRELVIEGGIPDVRQWAVLMLIGMATAWIGYAWFQKTRKGFADVI